MNSIKAYCNSKQNVAEYVEDIILAFGKDFALTTTITQEKSGDYCVVTAIDASSEDIERLMGRYYYKRQSTI